MVKGLPKEVAALGVVLGELEKLEETEQQWVLGSAMSKLGIGSIGERQVRGSRSAGGNGGDGHEGVSGDSMTAKQFLRQKNPRSDVQRVACLAYYLANYRSTPHFKTKELSALNVEAAGTKIGNVSQAVNNATKQSHYLAPAGGGTKQITSFGEDVVGALPDQDAVKRVEQDRPKRRKGGRKRAKR